MTFILRYVNSADMRIQNSAILRSKDKYRNEGRCDLLSGFCGRFDATTALMFIGFLTTLGAMAMGFFSRRSGNRHSAV